MTPGGEDPKPSGGYKKDPTKGTDVGKNDNPGPGKDTNNGVGAKTSTEDLPTNSGNLKTPEEYKEAMDPVVNNPGKAGGEKNNPTVTPKPGAKVDDGNVGNDNNIDKPTPVSPPAQGSDGTPISSEPAGEWEGPPD